LIKGGLSKEADMFNNTEEHIWQFDVENGAHIKDNGRSHFESRANEMAAKIGCNLVGIKNVQLDFLRGRWKITGTAILKKLKATG
jgi:hypothetical protein